MPLVRDKTAARDEVAVEDLEQWVQAEDCVDPLVGIKGEGRALAQMQKAHDRIDVAVGQQDGGDGTRAQALAGVKDGVGFDLLAQVR